MYCFIGEVKPLFPLAIYKMATAEAPSRPARPVSCTYSSIVHGLPQ